MAKIKFYFYKAKRLRWDMSGSQDWRIMYKRQEIGSIERQDNGQFKVLFQADATPEQLATNPNCDWSWARLKQRFNTAEQAKDWITENATLFYDYIAAKFKHGA